MAVVDFEPIRNALFDWLNESINGGAAEGSSGTIPILRAETNGANEDPVRPAWPKRFVEYKFLTGLTKIGSLDELIVGSGGECRLRHQRQFTVSVSAFGESASGIIAAVQNGFRLPAVCSVLDAAGLSVRNDESFSDNTVFLETSFEERAVYDVIFGIALETPVDVGQIETVEVTSNNPGGKVSTIDKTIGVTVTDP